VAARLVLGQSEPFSLQANGPLSNDDEILILRDSLLAALRERTLTVGERISHLLNLCGAAFPTATPAEWAAVLLSLERLDEAWGERLVLLRDTWSTADIHGFDTHMQQRQTEYEQWLAYLIYRHVANAATLEQAAVRTLFAVLGYVVLYALGAVLWTKNGVFSFEEQCDLARAFSAEIEYSDENFYILLDALGGVY
jgi:multidrug transporter EmrE-like cation transporter